MTPKISTPFDLDRKLTKPHLESFREHGVIQFKKFIDKDTLNLFLKEVQGAERYLLQRGVTKVNGIPLKFGQDVDGKPLIQRIAFTSHYSPILKDFLKDPRLQALIQFLGDYEGRIGVNEKDGLVFNHYVNTGASAFKQLGWHTDSPRDLFLGSRIRPMLNVGLHLDDCPAENGGLRVLPGTHTQGLFGLFFRKRYFVDNNPDKREIGFDIEAGDLTVHDGRLWHRVQQSSIEGEKSRRRVMYIPIITGAYQPKTPNSATPFYHRLARIKRNPENRKVQLAAIKADSLSVPRGAAVAAR